MTNQTWHIRIRQFVTLVDELTLLIAKGAGYEPEVVQPALATAQERTLDPQFYHSCVATTVKTNLGIPRPNRPATQDNAPFANVLLRDWRNNRRPLRLEDFLK